MKAALILLSFAAAASAQSHPDFSGSWTVSPAEASSQGPRRGALGSGWGDEIVILQEADTLTVEREIYVPYDLQPKLKLRYSLDGSESANTLMLGRGMQKLVSTAAWQGEKLVVKTRDAIEVRRTLWLDPSGNPARPPSLVIETERGGATTRTVYIRR